MDHSAKFQDIAAFRKFALAGNAVFTIVSKKTGARFTYRIRKPRSKERKTPFFVQVLTGPDNTRSYSYFGLIFGEGAESDWMSYRFGISRAKLPRSATSVQAFEWLVGNITNPNLLDKVEIWHEGRCGKCRKPLTVPSSIESGLGPVCAKS